MSQYLRRLTAALALALVPTLAVAQTRAGLQDGMRRLWTDHVTWTRLFIVSAAAGLPDQEATTQRLLQNQADIGTAVAGYYGQEAGAKLTALLKSHIVIAGDLVAAAKAGNSPRVDSLNASWRANASEIAVFLHGANPRHWPEATLRTAMYMHLDQTLAEATHRLKGDYAADVRDFDAIETHILVMADMLSRGIIAQFPSRFTGGTRAVAR